MDIYEMLAEAGYGDQAFQQGQHYCAAVIQNAGVATYEEACEAYTDAGGSETQWH